MLADTRSRTRPGGGAPARGPLLASGSAPIGPIQRRGRPIELSRGGAATTHTSRGMA